MSDAVRQQGADKGSTIIPAMRYRDAHAAIEWLVRVFGFTKQAVYATESTVMHAQLTYGQGMVMLGSVKEGNEFHKLLAQPDEIGGRETTSVCLTVGDPDALFVRAKAAGAEIVQEIHSPEYGGRSFACRDLEGHIWWIGSYDPWAGHGAAAADETTAADEVAAEEKTGEGMSANPYASYLGDLDPVEVIVATPDRLTAYLEKLSVEEVEEPLALGKWTPRQVVSHLADCEIAFSFRLRQTKARVGLQQPFDQDVWADMYGRYTLEAALAAFRGLREFNLQFVKALSQWDKEIKSTHPERGDMTLWTIVETMAGHDLNHLTRLEAARG